MKKTFALLLISIMIFNGCANVVNKSEVDKNKSNSDLQSKNIIDAKTLSFEADFNWNKDFAEKYLSQESMAQISYSGPFYFGDFLGVNSFTIAYTEERSKKVEQILKIVDENVRNLKELEDIVKNYRNVLDWYILNIANFMPEVKENLYALIDDSEKYAILNVAKVIYLNTLVEKLTTTTKDSQWGFLAYNKYYLTFDLAQSLTDELVSLNKKFVLLYGMSKAKGFDELLALNLKLDENLQPISEKANLLLNKIAYNGALLAHEEKVLATADVYFSKEVLANFENQIPVLKKAISDYKFGKPAVDQLTIDMMKDQLELYENYAKDLKLFLDKIPANQLADKIEFNLPGAGGQAYIPKYILRNAHADFSSAMNWLGGKMAGAAEVGVNVAAVGASVAWDATKTVAGKAVEATIAVSDATGVTPYVVTAKNATIKTVKFTGKVIGTGLDAASAVVKSPADVINGVYYGNSAKEILKTLKDNFTEVADNVHNGIQGHQVYEDTKVILDKSDEVVSGALEGLTKLTVGEGVTSKTVGFAAKTVSGFFTGFGKDLVTVLNPNTSEKDTLVSLFGLALSGIGGTGSALKGSEALTKGAPKLFQGLGKLKQFISSVDGAAMKEGVTDLFEGGIKGALKSTFSKQGLSMGLETLKDLTSVVKSNLGTALEDGYGLLKGNLMTNVPKAFQGLFDKKSLAAVFKDVLGVSDKANWRQATIGLLDNIVGSVADDNVKSWLDSGFQQIGISEQTITGLMEERKKAIEEIKKLIITQLPAIAYLFSVVTPGAYSSNISFSVSQYGITMSGSGSFNLVVSDNMTLSCSMKMPMKVSGGYQGMAVGGSGTVSESACSGNVNADNGELKMSGGMTGISSVVVSGYGSSQKSSGGRTVPFVGKGIIKDGLLSGTLTAEGFSFKIGN